MNASIETYCQNLGPSDLEICTVLAGEIDRKLPMAENKIWHGHPVWFLSGNPIVGFSKQKAGLRLMFWSGADFEEAALIPGTGKFKDASVYYADAADVNTDELSRWLDKARAIQWDYKNIVKRKGLLLKIEQ
jgi:hypothetical protein